MPWPLAAISAETLSPAARAALYVPAKVYELGVRLRMALYETAYLKPRQLSKPVIAVGNLTVGGTGKTPLVEYIARYLTDESHETVILTRGYGRTATARARVVLNDGQPLPDWSLAGDEPLMLARRLPDVKIIVGADRYANGRFAETTYGCDVFVLDDGFQHLQLARDLNILVLDATDPFGNGDLLPFGRLREPLYALRRADAIVVTRTDRTFDQEHLLSVLAACEVTAPVFLPTTTLWASTNWERAGRRRSAASSGRRWACFRRWAIRPSLKTTWPTWGPISFSKSNFPTITATRPPTSPPLSPMPKLLAHSGW